MQVDSSGDISTDEVATLKKRLVELDMQNSALKEEVRSQERRHSGCIG